MKKRIIRLFAALLAAVVCSVSCLATDMGEAFAGKSLEGVIAEFREQYHLNTYNFAFSYYNTVTGEQCSFNEEKMMIAASTYKMPLNLYYYTMELNGEIETDAYIPGAGMTLDKAHERSLVHSDNDVSEGMLYHLGNFRQYKEKMRMFFTMTDEEIESDYYNGNYYCTRMMTDALRYLYEHSENYGEMLGYMKQACPNAYFRRLVTEYEVAHKYGSYEGAENDVGIIYTKQPFLLVVYTQNAGGEEVCAQLARLVTDYNVYYTGIYEQEQAELLAQQEQQKQQEQEQTQVQQTSAEEAAPPPAVSQPIPAAAEEKQPSQTLTWWMFAVAGGICLLGGLFVSAAFRKPGKFEEKYKKKYGKYLDEKEESTVE